MKEKKKHTVFVEGPITSAFISAAIARHQDKTEIGAHSIFLGQVRKDILQAQEVVAIEYSAYTEMALEKFTEIREKAFAAFNLVCLHIYHSLGMVKAGEISLFVFVSAKHRKEAIAACEDIVERIKKEVPIWGKEWLTDQQIRWKINS